MKVNRGKCIVTEFMGSFIADRVKWVEQHAGLTILLITVLTIAAGVYSSFYASINSDLSQLIKPSADTAWYQDNEEYKRIFPDAQQTAVIVVSGESYREVENPANFNLYERLGWNHLLRTTVFTIWNSTILKVGCKGSSLISARYCDYRKIKVWRTLF